MSGGASRTVCPHLAPWREGPLMWLRMECCCSFLSATKATCFYFLKIGPCYLELWRNTVRYVTYEMNGMNANQQNTSQRGLCQPGTGPNVLFLAALSKSSLLSVHVELHCTHTHTQSLTWTHTNTHHVHASNFSTIVIIVCPFQLLSSLLRDSFNRGHFRFCHTHSSANGLQRTPKYWICIYFPLQRGSASQAPFDSPQNPTRFEQEPSAGFLTSVRATFLYRRETTLGKYSAGPQGFSS